MKQFLKNKVFSLPPFFLNFFLKKQEAYRKHEILNLTLWKNCDFFEEQIILSYSKPIKIKTDLEATQLFHDR